MSTPKRLTPEESETFCLKVLAICDTNGTTALMTVPGLWPSKAAKLQMTIEVAVAAANSGDLGWSPERTAALIKAEVLRVLVEATAKSYYATYSTTPDGTTERKIAEAMAAPVQGKVH